MADARPGPHERALREASEHFNENLDQLVAGEDVPIHPIWAEEVEIVNFEPSPFPGTYHGHDGLVQWAHDLFDELTDARIDMIEIREDGDLVAARLRLSGRGRASGAEGSFEWGALFEMRDGRLNAWRLGGMAPELPALLLRDSATGRNRSPWAAGNTGS